MFIAHLNRGQYNDKKMTRVASEKYSQFGYPLGGSILHDNGFTYNAAIAVELLSHEPQQDNNYLHQVWIRRKEIWFNLDNNEQRVYPMPNEPQNPTLVVYELEGEVFRNEFLKIFC